MATQRKPKKKSTKSKKTASKKAKPAKTVKPAKKLAKTKPVAKKIGKRSAAKRTAEKRTAGKKTAPVKNQTRKQSARPADVAFSLDGPRSPSSEESGDLQGLSRVEGADSESVDELLEEGNAFEADVVAGVERADNADEQEVRTHEVPEDDVPGEYLDED
jgi:hypothetical protein